MQYSSSELGTDAAWVPGSCYLCHQHMNTNILCRESDASKAAMQKHVQGLRAAQAHMFELSEQVTIAELASELAEARAHLIQLSAGIYQRSWFGIELPCICCDTFARAYGWGKTAWPIASLRPNSFASAQHEDHAPHHWHCMIKTHFTCTTYLHSRLAPYLQNTPAQHTCRHPAE